MENDFIFRENILKGQVAFITGGASGIGFGIAQRLAAAGADVALLSRRQELCEEKAAEIRESYGVRALGLALDVRDSQEIAAVMRRAVDELGGLDILVNNAAGNFYFPAEKLRDKLWNSVIDIDLNGTFYCCRTAFKYLKERGGSIISISSNLQKDGWVGMAHACAAKSGIDALTKTLAQEWARFNIRVNAISPGPIATEGVMKAFEAAGDFEAVQRSIPLGRSGKPEEIGDFAVFLCSSAASWMTGTIVQIDGGEALSPQRAGISPEQLEDMVKNRKKK